MGFIISNLGSGGAKRVAVHLMNNLNLQKFNWLKEKLLKRSYKNFDKIITQSHDMTKDLLQNINICKNKIIEINNPVDLERIEKFSNKK